MNKSTTSCSAHMFYPMNMFIKNIIFMFLLMFFTFTTSAFAYRSDLSARSSDEVFTGDINIVLGQKQLKSSDWEPADKQSEFAIDMDFQKQSWPVSMEIGLRSSDAKGTISGYMTNLDVETRQREISLGIRKVFHDANTNVHPHIGAGISLINTEAIANGCIDGYCGSLSQSADATGIWIGAGVYWTINNQFNIGPEVRFTSATAKLLGQDQEVGGTHIGITLGYHY